MNAAAAPDPFDPPTRILVDGTAYQDLPRWYRAAEALRRSPTLPRVEAEGFFPFWAVTRHGEVAEIERQHELFPNTETSVLLPLGALEQQKALGVQIKSLVHMDDPEHREVPAPHQRLVQAGEPAQAVRGAHGGAGEALRRPHGDVGPGVRLRARRGALLPAARHHEHPRRARGG